MRACCVAAAGARRTLSSTAIAAAAAATVRKLNPNHNRHDSKGKKKETDNEELQIKALFNDRVPQRTPFQSPANGLDPGLIENVFSVMGSRAMTRPIQTMAFRYFLANHPQTPPDSRQLKADSTSPTETLITSQTGSGKTLAYALPLIQLVKDTEHTHSRRPDITDRLKPRAIILAPTHELARQLSENIKRFCHVLKLRVLCLSAAGYYAQIQLVLEPDLRKRQANPLPHRNPDIIVSTPARLLSWLQDAREFDSLLQRANLEHLASGAVDPKVTKGKLKAMANTERNLKKGRSRGGGETKRERRGAKISLVDVRAVVIDEADVLLAPDFGPSTRAVLHIARKEQSGELPAPLKEQLADASAPEIPKPSTSKLTLDDITAPRRTRPDAPALTSKQSSSVRAALDAPTKFPFDVLFATATVSTVLAGYLNATHPNLVTLAAENVHKLPQNLDTVFVDPQGNKMAAIATQLRAVLAVPPRWVQPMPGMQTRAKLDWWLEDAEKRAKGLVPVENKIVIFVNRAHTAQLLGDYLTEQGIRNITVTSQSGTRLRNSNAHIKTFLRQYGSTGPSSDDADHKPATATSVDADAETSAKSADDGGAVTPPPDSEDAAPVEEESEHDGEDRNGAEDEDDEESLLAEARRALRREKAVAAERCAEEEALQELHADSRHTGEQPEWKRNEAAAQDKDKGKDASADETSAPRVLITTSLLSRGIDFDPSVTHVFLPDRVDYSSSRSGARRLATQLPGREPFAPAGSSSSTSASQSAAALRAASEADKVWADAGINVLEILHRAGRAARAGARGTLVIFDKRAAQAMGSGAGRAGGFGAAAAAAVGGSEPGRGRSPMVRNKQGKMVYKAAVPLRRAMRSLKAEKKTTQPWAGRGKRQ